MGFLVPLITTIASTAAGAAGAVGGAISTTASSILGGGGVGAATAGGGLSKGLAGLQAASTIAALAQGTPKPPAVGTPPTTPVFGASLATGGNRSLAAQSPLAASGGTNTGSFAAPGPSGAKTLLGQ